MTDPDVVVLPDEAAIASEAAERIAASLANAVADRGRADWATTGGSMAPPIYRRLAAEPLRDAVPWSAVHVWWGDDRFVPRDHPLSNVKPLDDILLAIAATEGGQVGMATTGAPRPVPLPIDNLHPFPTGAAIGGSHDAAWCAAQLAAELRTAGPELVNGWPVFDLVLLGIGTDGHLLSVFPGSDAFDSGELALAIPAPTHIEPHVERVTLNPAVVRIARQVLVVAGGAGKAAVIAELFRQPRDPNRWPAQLARRAGAVWVLDRAAAAQLDH
ncbi:MAG: 6-phosphogluconolactonase [Chloroflexota bacterium]